jgi:hypothetical protein
MKVHSYTYRGKTVDVYKATVSDIENSLKDKNYLEFTDKGITTRLFVKALNVNDQSQSITVDFFFKEVVKSTTDEGVDIETETFASKSLSETSIGSYVNLYKSEVEGMLGDFIRHGQFDILALAKNYKTGSYFIGEMAYPCNSLNNYSWMQPLSYDLTTTETGVTVTVVDTLESYNLEYSLDGETYQDLVETEIPLEVGSYTITVRAKEELYPFPSNFSILEPVIEDDLIQENE